MPATPLHFVLGLLRRIKSRPEFQQGQSVQTHISVWAGDGGQDACLRMALALQQNLAEARGVIARSGLTDEAKGGLLATVDGLINAFSLHNLATNFQSHIPALDSAITNFAILASAVDLQVSDKFIEQRDSFVSELEAFAKDIDGFDIDERLKDVSKRQIALLIALLKNAEAVGVEPALSAYWELMIKVKSRLTPENEDQEKDNSRFWDVIISWSDRFDALSKLYDFGNKIIPHLDKFPQIPGF